MKLTILIPAHNEDTTIEAIIDKVFSVSFDGTEIEVIVIDDGSTDRTNSILNQIKHPITVMRNERALGKSGALHKGIAVATGEYIVIQDADLEYDPEDIHTLLTWSIENKAPIVYGSRRLGRSADEDEQPRTIFFFGGLFVTKVTNLLFGTRLTDEPTCYKLVRSDLLKRLKLHEGRFGFCPEVTAKALRLGNTIPELPIRYYPRSIEEGKKIRAKDGLHAIWILGKYRILPISWW